MDQTHISAEASLPVGASLAGHIRASLEEAIIDGEFEPGLRLRADEVAARYRVSRIPVREALSALDAAGWVEIRPRYGVYVRQRTREELAELFEARAGLEQEIARLAAVRRTQDDLATMTRVVQRSRYAAAAGTADELSLAAVDFNAELRRAGKNAVLSSLSLVLEKRARFYFSPVAALLGGDWVVGQERLLHLLQVGDVDGSGASARTHVEETGRSVSRLLGSDAFSS